MIPILPHEQDISGHGQLIRRSFCRRAVAGLCAGKDHLSRFIVALVRESTWICTRDHRRATRARSASRPSIRCMMTALLLLCLSLSGLYSSRRIAKACAERVDFHDDRGARSRRISAPSADFRKRHSDGVGGVCSLQVLEAGGKSRAGEAGSCRARRHQDQGERLQTQSHELRAHEEARGGTCKPRWIAGLAAAEAADAARGQRLRHRTSRGDEMPAWIADKQKRLGQNPRGQGKRLKPRPQRRLRLRSKAEHEAEEKASRPKDRKQLGGTKPQAALWRARARGPAQFHRSGQPRAPDQGRLSSRATTRKPRSMEPQQIIVAHGADARA